MATGFSDTTFEWVGFRKRVTLVTGQWALTCRNVTPAAGPYAQVGT